MIPCQLQPIFSLLPVHPPLRARARAHFLPPLVGGFRYAPGLHGLLRVLVLCEGRGSSHIIHRRLAMPGPLPVALPVLRKLEPTPRLELGTCRLRIGCSAN